MIQKFTLLSDQTLFINQMMLISPKDKTKIPLVTRKSPLVFTPLLSHLLIHMIKLHNTNQEVLLKNKTQLEMERLTQTFTNSSNH